MPLPTHEHKTLAVPVSENINQHLDQASAEGWECFAIQQANMPTPLAIRQQMIPVWVCFMRRKLPETPGTFPAIDDEPTTMSW